jgi:uncharacterized protein
MTLTPMLVALVFAAGVVNGWTSIGFAMITAAGLALAIDPKLAVLLLAVTNPFVSSVQILNHRRHAPGWRRLVPIALGSFAGVPLGAALLGILTRDMIAIVLGGVALFFVTTTLLGRGPRIPSRWERPTAPVAGLVAGMANGTVGVSGPVLGTYLVAIGTSPAAFGFSISALFLSMGIVRLASLLVLDQLTTSLLVSGALLLVPALLGQQAGLWLHRRVAPARARQGALIVMGVAGLSLIIRGLGVAI